MRRRLLMALGAGALVTLSAAAQQQSVAPRIGLLWIGPDHDSKNLAAFLGGLRTRGYVEGQNIQIDTRFLVSSYDRQAEAANQLVDQKVDVIVSYGATATAAAAKATSTIPIVMVVGADPVKLGVVASLSRPGGNVTGVTLVASDLRGKRLEILQELVPNLRSVGFVYDPESPAEAASVSGWEAAAATLHLQLQRVEIRTANDIDIVLSGIGRQVINALAVSPSSLFAANRDKLVTAIGKTRLPAVYSSRDYVEAGGLISFGSNLFEGFHLAAEYVDKILKGAKPADIPVQQPSRFELVINGKTAKSLGITIPRSLLLRADEVIQ